MGGRRRSVERSRRRLDRRCSCFGRLRFLPRVLPPCFGRRSRTGSRSVGARRLRALRVDRRATRPGALRRPSVSTGQFGSAGLTCSSQSALRPSGSGGLANGRRSDDRCRRPRPRTRARRDPARSIRARRFSCLARAGGRIAVTRLRRRPPLRRRAGYRGQRDAANQRTRRSRPCSATEMRGETAHPQPKQQTQANCDGDRNPDHAQSRVVRVAADGPAEGGGRLTPPAAASRSTAVVAASTSPSGVGAIRILERRAFSASGLRAGRLKPNPFGITTSSRPL